MDQHGGDASERLEERGIMVQLLREIKEHAEREDVAWLTKRGKVYAAVEAA
jgi:hypothetical protein